MVKTPLKVGFDLDGVILYNPLRIVRPILSFFRNTIIKKPKKEFYIPKSLTEKFIWYLIHKSSLKPARGYGRIEKLKKTKKITPYLITGRYNALESDFENWKKRIDAESVFVKCLYNKNSIQPHEFKKQMIKKYNLDIFVEDNWDIINLLNNNNGHFKILWVTNYFDRLKKYQFKFASLNKVLDYLEDIL